MNNSNQAHQARVKEINAQIEKEKTMTPLQIKEDKKKEEKRLNALNEYNKNHGKYNENNRIKYKV